nr:octapeptide-repeat protein T2-like isoform X5 [Penaeus vannamei]
MLYVESTKPSYFSGEGKCCGGEGEEEDAGEGDEGEVRLEGGGGDQPAEGVRLEGGGGGQPEEGKRRHQRETEEKGSRNQTSRDRVRGQDAGHEHSLQRQGGRGKRPEEGEGRPDARDRKKGRGDQRAKGPGEEGAKGPAKGRERGRGREGRLQGANRRPRGTQCVSPVSSEEESRKNRALTTQIAEKESELTQAEADHEKRVKNLKKREKRKEKEAAEERGELESELKRRDKRIEDLKPPRDPEAPGPGQPSAAGRSSGSSWQRRHSACSCQGRGESSGRRGRQASASNWQKGQGQEGTGGRRATASSRHG